MVKLLRLIFGYSKVMFINLLRLLVGTTLLVLPSFHHQHPQPSQSVTVVPATVSTCLLLAELRARAFKPWAPLR